MTLDRKAGEFGVIGVEPNRQRLSPNKPEIGVISGLSKMPDASMGQGAVSHDAVGRSSYPTCFELDTSYTVSDLNERADHVGRSDREGVWLDPLDRDLWMVTRGIGRDLYQAVDEPFNAS